MVKSLLQRLEESVNAKMAALQAATFSSVGALNVHAKGISIDLRELEAQIAALRQDAVLKGDPDVLASADKWSSKYADLVARSHQLILDSKARIDRRKLIAGTRKSSSMQTQLDRDVTSHFERVGKSLGEAVERSVAANVHISESTQTVKRVGQRYKEFGDDVLTSSQRLIRRYAQKEERDWRLYRLSLYLFVVVLVFVLYMRMPLVKSVVVPFIVSLFKRTVRAGRNDANPADDHASSDGGVPIVERPEL